MFYLYFEDEMVIAYSLHCNIIMRPRASSRPQGSRNILLKFEIKDVCNIY